MLCLVAVGFSGTGFGFYVLHGRITMTEESAPDEIEPKVDVERTPNVRILGMETGGTLVLKYEKPPASSVPGSPRPGNRAPSTGLDLSPQDRADLGGDLQDLRHELSIIIFGDGTVIGDRSRSTVFKR